MAETTLTRLLRKGAHELIADTRESPPVVTGAVVGGRRVGWPLSDTAAEPTGDLLLVRDLLDVQIVDRDGRHRGRVGDVELAEDAQGRLRVTAVETGLRPVLRRLGLGALSRDVSFSRLEWHELQTAPGRPHAVRSELPPPRHLYRRVLRVRRKPPS
jgi:hypothetical protein